MRKQRNSVAQSSLLEPIRPDLTTASDATALAVRRSPERQAAESLAKEHERLLRSIARKRTSLEETVRILGDAEVEFTARAEPLRTTYEGTAKEIHALFGKLLGPESRLSHGNKAKVRRVYADFAESVPTTEHVPDAPDDPFDSIPPESEDTPGPRQASGRHDGRRGPTETQSAPKRSNDPSALRALFRRLTIALHPDKSQNDAEKAERTEVMKDVTRAYESGDLARLVEIERSHLAQALDDSDVEDWVRKASQLREANAALRRQLQRLRFDEKTYLASTPLTFGLRANGELRGAVKKEIDRVLSEAKREIDELGVVHDFVRRFAEGKISLKEFLAGPPIAPAADSLSETLLDMALEFLEELGDPVRHTARRPPKKKGRSRSKQQRR